MKKLIGLLLLVWLLIGLFAAFQRGYLNDDTTDCADVGTIALNVVAGPLNYWFVDPEVEDCDVDVPDPEDDDVPQPTEDAS